MKKSLVALTALLLVFLLAACASAEVLPGTTEAPLPEATEQPRPSSEALSETKLALERTENPSFSNFKSVALTGETVDQTLFADHKLTMINIWGTYCNHCISKMPDLADLDAAYEEGEFQVVGMIVDMLNTDGSVHPMAVEAVWAIIDATGADYTHLLPTDDIITMKLQYLVGVPETVFVDSQGNILTPDTQYIGARSYEDWKSIIDGLLAELPGEAVQSEQTQTPAP